MSPDKFPEAFERYEKDIDTSEIKGFKQLLWSFTIWGDKKVYPSKKQIRALAVEAKAKDITPYIDSRGYRSKTTGRFSKEKTPDTVEVIHYRDPITGRFIKRPEVL